MGGAAAAAAGRVISLDAGLICRQELQVLGCGCWEGCQAGSDQRWGDSCSGLGLLWRASWVGGWQGALQLL